MNRNRRPLLVIIAAVLAAGAGLLAFDYLAQPHAQAMQAPPRPVVVALIPIGAHQPINSSMVRTVMRPADSIDPGAFSSVDAVNGNVALADIPANAALTSSNTSRPSAMPSLIKLLPGTRAMSIPVDEVKDVSGLIQPGDHVDVYAVPPRMGSETPQAFAILRNVMVLAIGGLVEAAPVAQGASPPPQSQMRSVTLRVTAQQAKILAVADLNSTLRLALRPPDEPTRSESTDAFVLPASGNNAPVVPAAAPAPAAAAAPPAPAPAPQQRVPNDGVEYILGDRVQGGSGSH